jgi:Ca2+-dependent lipid-binding protein
VFEDPYVTVSLAKFGKPLYSTRIIVKETQPVWEATAVILIRPEAFRVKEKIALRELALLPIPQSIC